MKCVNLLRYSMEINSANYASLFYLILVLEIVFTAVHQTALVGQRLLVPLIRLRRLVMLTPIIEMQLAAAADRMGQSAVLSALCRDTSTSRYHTRERTSKVNIA